MKIKNKAWSIHELGQRTNQEDSLWPDDGKQPAASDLYILCDGMGGHESGEVASQTVCQAMSDYILAHRREDGTFGEEDFRAALDAAYDALDAKDNGAAKKMGTTLVFVKFHRDGCFVAHIGDSRVYHVRPSSREVLFVTRDHSLVNDLVQLGELTEEEARTSRQKNIITRAMQPNQERRTKADWVNLTDLEQDDYIYMCSDGMLEISEDREIVNILAMKRSDPQKVEILKGSTKNNRDNHSAHLIHITSVERDGEPAAGAGEKNPVAAAPVAPAAPAPQSSAPVPADPEGGCSCWKWTVAVCSVLLLVGAIAFVLTKCSNENPKSKARTEQRS